MSTKRIPYDPDEIFGPPRPSIERTHHLRLTEDDPEFQGPDPDEQTETQIVDAVYRIHEDTSGYPSFPWAELDRVAGRMAPSELWIVAARTQNGKTLFLLNLFDDLVQKQGISTFYIGLEQPPKDMRIKWACMRSNVPVAGALAGKWPDQWGPQEIEDAKAAIQVEMQRQKSGDLKALARFCEARFINAALLKVWTQWAVDHGSEVIIVDHINRIARDGDKSSFDAHSHVVTTAKELAVEHNIVMLAASQVGRPNGDPLQKFTPPALHELRGGGTSEEEANTVLIIYRPLNKETATPQQQKLVRQGLAEESTLYTEGLMAIRVAKHRLLGLQKDTTAVLRVEHGRILNRY